MSERAGLLRRTWHRLFGERQPVPIEQRARWESGRTTRLNSAHWTYADGSGVNVNLAADLITLRNRAIYEAANNAFVRGVIHTYCCDVVGARGPVLQVQSESDDYNTALEGVWRAWWESPEASGTMSGIDLLYQWVGLLWTHGEYLAQFVSAQTAEPGEVATRVLSLNPRRLATPPEAPRRAGLTLGVRRNDWGEPIEYLIELAPEGDVIDRAYKYVDIPASRIIHGFRADEPGQARGVPYLAPSLDACADIRAYDSEVLDAARAAATHGILLQTKHPDAGYFEVNESVDIERRTISTLPPGWEAMQMRAEQPMSEYPDYRAERVREIGRGVSMPLMMIRLDSSKHSYSSARFDNQCYWRGIRTEQARMERVALRRMLAKVEREATLLGLLPSKPADARAVWYWEAQPHVDPSKEAAAEEAALKNGTITLGEALANRGTDLETSIMRRQREQELLTQAGLPVPWWSSNEAKAGPAEPEPTPTEPDESAARLLHSAMVSDGGAADAISRGDLPAWATPADAARALDMLRGDR